MTRKPSCLISCSQNDPEGGCGALVGRHGGMNPVGKGDMPNVIGQRAVLSESKQSPDQQGDVDSGLRTERASFLLGNAGPRPLRTRPAARMMSRFVRNAI